MRYLSVCSGIEAASVAWHDLGWEAAGFSEIERFPSEVLRHRFPNVRNYGDMTNFKEWEDVGTVDLLVGGTPCQSFSVAGLRKGLADPRGNLMLTFGAIAHHFKARWVVWENVPGVLSSNKGRDFGSFLGMLAECGYGFAYRVLDAQFFGVPQRRRRVFVVGCLGSWLNAAKVLFDSGCLSGNPPPSREKGKEAAGNTQNSTGKTDRIISIGIDEECNATVNGMGTLLRGGQGGTRQAVCLMNQGGQIMDVEHDKTGTLRAQMGGHVPIVLARGQANAEILCDKSPTLNCNHEQPIVFNAQGSHHQGLSIGSLSLALDASKTPAVLRPADFAVRRLTPIECERLQGFPDDWTRIPYRGKPAEQCPDSPRYKACGNSMAVPVMRWIGERIEKVNRERK